MFDFFYDFHSHLFAYFIFFVGFVIAYLPELLSEVLKKDIDFYDARREQKNKSVLYGTIGGVTHLILGNFYHNDDTKAEINKWIDNEFKLDCDNIMHWVEQKLPYESPRSHDDDIVLQYYRIIEDRGLNKETITVQNLLDITKMLLFEFNSKESQDNKKMV